ncbi:hypothetical protein BDW71DRAFT_203267 [Aspergillus fruticulosus]
MNLQFERDRGTQGRDTVNNIGNLYRAQGKLKEAEKMYQQALAGYEKALGPNYLTHPPTMSTVNNLGNLYFYQDKLIEAEEMYQQALAGYKTTLGPDHTSTLNTVKNLGNLYSDQGKHWQDMKRHWGKLKEAEEVYQRALAGKEKALGPNHLTQPPTLNTVNDLGSLCRAQGKLKEAEEKYQRALAGYGKALGPDHSKNSYSGNQSGVSC